MFLRAIFVALLAVISSVPALAQSKPERVVMLYVDGLNPDAIDHFGLEAMAELRDRGASAREGVMPSPLTRRSDHMATGTSRRSRT